LPTNAARARSSSLSRKQGSVKAHRRRQPPEDLGVGQRFADRRDRRVVGECVQVAVRAVDVRVLELRRRGQQDISVVGVSVWKISWTTQNRSSRANPRATFADSGATATGFEL
jgi:hypothetical protein